MAVSEAQRRAAEKYRKANVRQISVRFYPDSWDCFEWARAQEGGAQGYIRDLIRADMERRSADEPR